MTWTIILYDISKVKLNFWMVLRLVGGGAIFVGHAQTIAQTIAHGNYRMGVRILCEQNSRSSIITIFGKIIWISINITCSFTKNGKYTKIGIPWTVMEMLHFEDLGDKSVVSECSLGVSLVIDNFLYVASGTSPLYKIWKQSDYYLMRYCILKIWGIRVSFGCKRSCSSPRRVSNSKYSIATYVRGVSTLI